MLEQGSVGLLKLVIGIALLIKSICDGINYGLFYSDRMMEKIVQNVVAETRRLGGKKILIGECGHATRSAWYVPTFGGDDPPEVVNCLEYAYEQLKAGKIPLKAEKIPERVTYHDPCNIARSGRIVEQPRELLKAICADYVEMTPNRMENYGRTIVDSTHRLVQSWRETIGREGRTRQRGDSDTVQGQRVRLEPDAFDEREDPEDDLVEVRTESGLDHSSSSSGASGAAIGGAA